MGKLFGTDGIRGVANETLDAKLAYRVGQAAAISLCDDPGTKPTVVIGKDTRISSDMLEGALVAGLTACGCNAILLGVVPTPAVAYLTIYLHADAGVVISASPLALRSFTRALATIARPRTAPTRNRTSASAG